MLHQWYTVNFFVVELKNHAHMFFSGLWSNVTLMGVPLYSQSDQKGITEQLSGIEMQTFSVTRKVVSSPNPVILAVT